MYSCDGKAVFVSSLLHSSVSHDLQISFSYDDFMLRNVLLLLLSMMETVVLIQFFVEINFFRILLLSE